MQSKLLSLAALTAAATWAAGSGNAGGVPGVTAPGAAEVRTLSERVPAGGTVQVKYLLTQPRPISTGGPRISTYGFSVAGVAATSPLGDTAGAAVAHDGFLDISVISPAGDYGTNLDYPFLTVTMAIPDSTPKGSTFPLTFPDVVYQTPTGPLTFTDPKPGTLTIGGSVSIHGVVPGAGVWPAGTVVSIQGTGFVRGTKILTKMRTSNPVFVSSTEMRFTLQQATDLELQPVVAQNPDGSQVTYYSYLRGVPVSIPSRDLLRKTDPIFQRLTHGLATVGPIATLAPGQFVALALQNPTPGPVSVTFRHDQSGTTNTIVLPSLGRLVDELSTLLGGLPLNAGDTVTVTSTSGIQILGLQGDDNLNTITPFLPAF